MSETLTKIDAKKLNELLVKHRRYVRRFKDGTRLNLAFVDASGVDLTGHDLTEAELRGWNLSGAKLAGAILVRAHLFGANLSNADLSKADLRRADMRGCNLRSPNFEDAIMVESDLRDGMFLFKNADGDFTPPNESQTVDAEGASMKNADLSGSKAGWRHPTQHRSDRRQSLRRQAGRR